MQKKIHVFECFEHKKQLGKKIYTYMQNDFLFRLDCRGGVRQHDKLGQCCAFSIVQASLKQMAKQQLYMRSEKRKKKAECTDKVQQATITKVEVEEEKNRCKRNTNGRHFCAFN